MCEVVLTHAQRSRMTQGYAMEPPMAPASLHHENISIPTTTSASNIELKMDIFLNQSPMYDCLGFTFKKQETCYMLEDFDHFTIGVHFTLTNSTIEPV